MGQTVSTPKDDQTPTFLQVMQERAALADAKGVSFARSWFIEHAQDEKASLDSAVAAMLDAFRLKSELGQRRFTLAVRPIATHLLYKAILSEPLLKQTDSCQQEAYKLLNALFESHAEAIMNAFSSQAVLPRLTKLGPVGDAFCDHEITLFKPHFPGKLGKFYVTVKY